MGRRFSALVCASLLAGVTPGFAADRVRTVAGVDASAKSIAISKMAKEALPQPILDGGLNRVLRDPAPLERARSLGFRVRDGQIQVAVTTVEGTTGEIAGWLEANGATGVLTAGTQVEAFVPLELLDSIDLDERVLTVTRPKYLPVRPSPEVTNVAKAGSRTTEGLAAMSATVWHNAGYSGDGVKVAVIDAGFEGYASLLGSDLPSASRVSYYDFTGFGMEGSPHGTACAEIVHDLVPNAAAMHIYAVGTDTEVANAVATAEAQGIDVISMSLGTLFWGPGDGTGVIADALNSFRSAGGLAVVSAGNFREGHWQGSWSDPDANDYLNFSSTVEVDYLTADGSNAADIPADTDISVQLVWNQWTAPATDLDLFLYHWNTSTESWDQVASSDAVQNGAAGQWPIEVISHTTTEAGAYGIVVQHYSGPTSIDIEVIVRPETLPLVARVASGSVAVPGDTASALSVAALDVASPYALESYSSRGPTNGPGGSLSGGSIKPDISGYANVSTVSYGTKSFNGTSAACPHVAGAAALVWSAHPSWTASQVRSYLESNAQDKGSAGKDNDYGYGRLVLASPPTSCSYSISPTSRSHNAGSGSATVTVSATSGCSWTASSNVGWLSITGGSSGSGNGTVSYSVSNNSSNSSRTGTLTVAGKTFTVTQSGQSSPPQSGSFTAYAVVARTTGTNNSVWQTSLSLTNVSSTSASVTLTYRYGNSGSVSRSVTIPAFGMVEWADAALGLFNVSGKSSGVVTIQANHSVLAAVRTFNSGADGTFGQSLPGVSSTESLTYGQFGILSPVRRTSDFRTNIGIINTGTVNCEVLVYFVNKNGGYVGDVLSVTLAPGGWKQINEAIAEAGMSVANGLYAVIQPETPGSNVWAYATVIDNSSGDPTALTAVIVD